MIRSAIDTTTDDARPVQFSWETMPQRIVTLLKRVQRTQFGIDMITFCVGMFAVIGLGMCVSMFLDWWYGWQHTLLRSIGPGSVALLATAWAIHQIRLAAFGKHRLARVAFRIDQRVPALEERLSTLAELADRPAGLHRAQGRFLQHLTGETQYLESIIQPRETVQWKALGRVVGGAAVALLILGLALLTDGPQTMIHLRRFWMPWKAIPLTQIASITGDMIVASGDSLTIESTLVGRPVEHAVLRLSTPSKHAASPPRELTLFPQSQSNGSDSQKIEYRLANPRHDYRYQFVAGDDQSPWFDIRLHNRPALAELQLTITPPTYTGKSPQEFSELPRSIDVLQGSHLRLRARATVPLKSFGLQRKSDQIVELAAASDGDYRYEQTLDESTQIALALMSRELLTNRDVPTCQLHVFPDRAPTVEIISPEEGEHIRPDDTLQVTFQATDDFGIQRVQLLIVKEPHSSLEGATSLWQAVDIPIDSASTPTKLEMTAEYDLAPLSLMAGTEFGYAIRVYDNRNQVSTQQVLPKGLVAARAQELTPEAPPTIDPPLASTEAPNAPRPSIAGTEPPPSTVPIAPATKPAAMPAVASPQASSSEPNPATPTTPSPPPAPPRVSPEPVEAEKLASNGPPQGSPRSEARREPPTANQVPSSATNQGTDSAPTPSDAPPSDAPPSDEMSRRRLDLGQSTTSAKRKLKVDLWAGTFSAQRRIKLELAIGENLKDLLQRLNSAAQKIQAVIDRPQPLQPWQAEHQQLASAAEGELTGAESIVTQLVTRAQKTPYEFIALQLANIRELHIEPASGELSIAQQSLDEERDNHARQSHAHILLAIRRLEELTANFERAKREHQLADNLDQVKRMYQIFVEDSYVLLKPARNAIHEYARKMGEVELSDEYRRLLEEFLEKRRKLQAELARILSEDPRLLRRYMDRMRSQSDTLRDKLSLLAERQGRIAGHVTHWQGHSNVRDVSLKNPFYTECVLQAQSIASAVADLHDSFHTWLPLEQEFQVGILQETKQHLDKAVQQSQQLNMLAARMTLGSDLESPSEASPPETIAPNNDAQSVSPAAPIDMKPLLTQAQQLAQHLIQVELLLPQIANVETHPRIPQFTARRTVEVRRIDEQLKVWTYTLEQLSANQYHRAMAVDQQILTRDTTHWVETFQRLAPQYSEALPPQSEGRGEIARLSAELTQTVATVLNAHQLAATLALRKGDLPAALTQLSECQTTFGQAEEIYDQIMQRLYQELDKIPPQPPDANLEDPTLEELLAGLEVELETFEDLGIMPRPTNVVIMTDWLSACRQGNFGAFQQARRAAGIRSAVATKNQQSGTTPDASGGTRSAWNTLISELENQLLQGSSQVPPEPYRAAIEQYFQQMAK